MISWEGRFEGGPLGRDWNVKNAFELRNEMGNGTIELCDFKQKAARNRMGSYVLWQQV